MGAVTWACAVTRVGACVCVHLSVFPRAHAWHGARVRGSRGRAVCARGAHARSRRRVGCGRPMRSAVGPSRLRPAAPRPPRAAAHHLKPARCRVRAAGASPAVGRGQPPGGGGRHRLAPFGPGEGRPHTSSRASVLPLCHRDPSCCPPAGPSAAPLRIAPQPGHVRRDGATVSPRWRAAPAP